MAGLPGRHAGGSALARRAAPPRLAEETIQIAKDYEFLVLFTSTPGFPGDIAPGQGDQRGESEASRSLLSGRTSPCCRKSRCAIARPSTSLPVRNLTTRWSSMRKASRWKKFSAFPIRRTARSCTIPTGRRSRIWIALPHVTEHLQARSGCDALQRSVPAASLRLALYDPRMPGAVHVLSVAADFERAPLAQALHRRRGREMAKARAYWPEVKEFFFDDDTFNIQKARTVELCAKLKPLGLTWSCTSRVTTDLRDAEGDEGSRMPPADRRLRVGRSADSEEHQEGRHRRTRPAVHQGLPQARPGHPRRLHPGTTRRNARDHSQHHQLRQGTRRRNHSGFRCARLSRAPNFTTTS